MSIDLAFTASSGNCSFISDLMQAIALSASFASLDEERVLS